MEKYLQQEDIQGYFRQCERLSAVLRGLEVPPLVDLALQRVVEEELEDGEMPSTLRAMVEEWPTRRQEEARAKSMQINPIGGTSFM